ncbi:MAG: Glyoxalase/bleomycin resistance protein/dioxygenase [Aeromicrobium sp.]|nr:Glyoxalase/bleomycin resistance protein/dioxygenase [Aeromicrobium sp.]
MTVSPSPVPIELAHHGITVTALDASASFFVDVLGFEVSPRIDLDETFSAGVSGVPGALISVVFVQRPGVPVELLQYQGPSERASVTTRPCDAGSAHLALYVDDVRDVVGRAAGYGWTPLGAVQLITTGPRAGGLAVYLHDPDGAVLELVQRPAPTPARVG